MTTKKKDEPVVEPEVSTQLTTTAPSWLAEAAAGDDSLSGMEKYRVLPRLALVQGTSSEELQQKHGMGAVVLFPGEGYVADYGQPFLLVPVFQFTEWVQYADRRDQNQPRIVERTRDANSQIARWSRMSNMREQEYPGGSKDKPFKYRFVEHILVASAIYGEHALAGEIVALNFSRGEFFVGTNFAAAVLMRRVGSKRAPLWTQVWQFHSAVRERPERKWYGLDFTQPETPWIQQHEAEAFRELYERLREDYHGGRIGADLETVEETETVGEAPSAAARDM